MYAYVAIIVFSLLITGCGAPIADIFSEPNNDHLNPVVPDPPGPTPAPYPESTLRLITPEALGQKLDAFYPATVRPHQYEQENLIVRDYNVLLGGIRKDENIVERNQHIEATQTLALFLVAYRYADLAVFHEGSLTRPNRVLFQIAEISGATSADRPYIPEIDDLLSEAQRQEILQREQRWIQQAKFIYFKALALEASPEHVQAMKRAFTRTYMAETTNNKILKSWTVVLAAIFRSLGFVSL